MLLKVKNSFVHQLAKFLPQLLEFVEPKKPPDKTSCGNVLMCQTRSQAIMIPPVSLPSIEMQASGHQQLYYDEANH